MSQAKSASTEGERFRAFVARWQECLLQLKELLNKPSEQWEFKDVERQVALTNEVEDLERRMGIT